MNTEELETILRSAPKPPIPAGLPPRLVQDVRQRRKNTTSAPPLRARWIRRWWPAVLIGGGVLACAATLYTQHHQIRRLQAQWTALPSLLVAEADLNASETSSAAGAAELAITSVAGDDKRAEMARLRAELAELQADAAQAEQLRAQYRELEAQLAEQSGLGAEDLAALDQARERAESIRCVNNMKNIGLALRVWAIDNDGVFPKDLLSMTNELVTPKLLVCPLSGIDATALEWVSFQSGQVSYEFLTPSGAELDPHCVAARCSFHRHILLSDGSVHMSHGDGSNLTRRLSTRDGKLYFDPAR